MLVWPGAPYPLGATYDGSGTNFAIFSVSPNAWSSACSDGSGDPHRADRRRRVRLARLSPEVQPGQLYGYRVDGPYLPATATGATRRAAAGPLCQGRGRPHRLERAASGILDARPSRTSRTPHPDEVVVIHPSSTGATTGTRGCRTARPSYTRRTSRASLLHPEIPEDLRGTYAGVAHPATMTPRSPRLTAIELMPIHQFVHDHHLQERS